MLIAAQHKQNSFLQYLTPTEREPANTNINGWMLTSCCQFQNENRLSLLPIPPPSSTFQKRKDPSSKASAPTALSLDHRCTRTNTNQLNTQEAEEEFVSSVLVNSYSYSTPTHHMLLI
eukprot:Phypoly_transcript_26233.p1 GENE.Phypoly_transcript_26233~~Phypoly_transcript_26233.p1  ORF type:complete len:118 (-),score=16.42 Phypoly_transcript_26233:40-393(-)